MQTKGLHDIEEMIISFREGADKGFSFFFKQYHKPLCYFAGRYVKSWEAAEDIVSDSFIYIWKNREKIETGKHLRNYLYRSVYHECLRWLGKEKGKENHLLNYATGEEKQEKDYSENIIKAETLQLLKLAIDVLPTQCSRIFYKIFIEGKSITETATELQLTPSTVRTQKARGIKLLKARLSACMLFFLLIIFALV